MKTQLKSERLPLLKKLAQPLSTTIATEWSKRKHKLKKKYSFEENEQETQSIRTPGFNFDPKYCLSDNGNYIIWKSHPLFSRDWSLFTIVIIFSPLLLVIKHKNSQNQLKQPTTTYNQLLPLKTIQNHSEPPKTSQNQSQPPKNSHNYPKLAKSTYNRPKLPTTTQI